MQKGPDPIKVTNLPSICLGQGHEIPTELWRVPRHDSTDDIHITRWINWHVKSIAVHNPTHNPLNDIQVEKLQWTRVVEKGITQANEIHIATQESHLIQWTANQAEQDENRLAPEDCFVFRT